MQKIWHTRATWLLLAVIVTLLCIPILVNLNTNYTSITPNDLLTVPFSISTALTVYSLLESGLGMVTLLLVTFYCREVLKRKTAKILRAGEKYDLEILHSAHHSLTHTSAGVMFFRNETISFSGVFVFATLIIRYTVEYYKAFFASTAQTVVYYNSTKAITTPTQLLYYPAITKDTFNGNIKPDFTKSQINQGGRKPTLYFGKRTPAQSFFFGQFLEPGTTPLFNWPAMTMPGLNNTFYQATKLPAAVTTITDWKYEIVQTNADPITKSFTFKSTSIPYLGAVTFASNASSTASYIYMPFGNDTDNYSKCLSFVSNPWLNCDVPDQLNFTIIQRLPDFTEGSYTDTTVWTTNVFHFSSNSQSTSSQSSQNSQTTKSFGLYVLTGTYQINRTELLLFRDTKNLTSSPVLLNQTYVSTYTDAGIETLYQQAKIAFIQNLVMNFNSSIVASGVGIPPPFEWSQASDFCIQGQLLYEFRNYSQADYITDLSTRLQTSNTNWLSSMTPTSDIVARIPSYNNSLRFNIQIINPDQALVLNASLLTGVFFMLAWILALIVMHALTIYLRRDSRSNSEYRDYAQLMDKVWSNAYGLEYLSKELVRGKDEGVPLEKQQIKLKLGPELLMQDLKIVKSELN